MRAMGSSLAPHAACQEDHRANSPSKIHQSLPAAGQTAGRHPMLAGPSLSLSLSSLKSQSPSPRARAAQPAHTTYRRCRAARSRSRGGQHERGGTNASGVPSVPALDRDAGGGAGRDVIEQRGRGRGRERCNRKTTAQLRSRPKSQRARAGGRTTVLGRAPAAITRAVGAARGSWMSTLLQQ